MMILTKPKGGGGGAPGQSGYSGISGYSGYDGQPGDPGQPGVPGISGYSGYSGISGISGYSGLGLSGYSGPSGYSGYSGFSGYSGLDGGPFSTDEKLNLELEMSFKAALVSNYKELSYTNGNLSAVTIYQNQTKLVTLFDKQLIYDSTSSNLVEIILTRHSDNITLTKDLSYDIDGNLFSITQTKG